MKTRLLSTTIAAFIFTALVLQSMVGCEDPSSSVSRPVIDPPDLVLIDVKVTPWVTKAGEPFTIEIIIRGVQGSELHFYPASGATINPDGSVTQLPPSGLMQNGTEPEYIVLHKDETYTENQALSEARFITKDVVLKNEASGIAVSTLRNVRLEDPATIMEFNMFRVLLPFRTAEPNLFDKPKITQLA
ncbi:MAG: hypothetical protein R3220_13060, partial [Balneolaceae bacterium]|nr:hypothetical protein [Balneolaceae bacterium]